jgi:hypothetical protein
VTRRHGVGKDGVTAIVASQGGGCAICGVLYEDTPGKRLAMDHDHTHHPGKIGCALCVRGMLCNRCNNILRLSEDDQVLLAKAIAYLDKWKNRPLIAM